MAVPNRRKRPGALKGGLTLNAFQTVPIRNGFTRVDELAKSFSGRKEMRGTVELNYGQGLYANETLGTISKLAIRMARRSSDFAGLNEKLAKFGVEYVYIAPKAGIRFMDERGEPISRELRIQAKQIVEKQMQARQELKAQGKRVTREKFLSMINADLKQLKITCFFNVPAKNPAVLRSSNGKPVSEAQWKNALSTVLRYAKNYPAEDTKS